MKITVSTWHVWVFSLPVCWIMYGYYKEKLHVDHFFSLPSCLLLLLFMGYVSFFFHIFCALKVNFFPIDSYGCFYKFYWREICVIWYIFNCLYFNVGMDFFSGGTGMVGSILFAWFQGYEDFDFVHVTLGEQWKRTWVTLVNFSLCLARKLKTAWHSPAVYQP